MKIAKLYIRIIFLGTFILGCHKTSTPEVHINPNKIGHSKYEKDKKYISQLVKSRKDSIRLSSATPEGKTLEVYIDTIFYGPDGKFVFLSISKKENQYAMNEEGISFSGESYIGLKRRESDKIKITDQLKYSSTSDETDGFKRVQKSIRNIYMREMEYIDDRYNINDNRFWTSQVWKIE